MLNGSERRVLYDSIEEKIFIYEEQSEEPITGSVCFNHYKKEVRIYDLNKEKLTNAERVEIIYAILEEQNYVPFIIELFGVEKDMGVEDYALLVNGYLIDGSYKEEGTKYQTLIEELIENHKEYKSSKSVSKILCNIDYLYKKYEDKFGKEDVKIILVQDSIFRGFREYIIFTDLLLPYLKVKGKNCVAMTKNNLLKTQKEITLVPTKEYIMKYCKF